MPSVSRSGQIQWFEQVCRDRRLPVTVQRRTVFEVLLGREDHPTADQVYDELKPRIGRVSRTTVYRILETFVDLGLIVKICHPGSAARFDPKVRRHDHLVCMHCNKVIDIEDSRLDGIVWPDVRGRGFEISDYHIHFRGICSDCRKRRKGGDRASKLSPRSAGTPAGRSGRVPNKKGR
jgi:Fur family transcriptional regulator, peroxide stress response regulator